MFTEHYHGIEPDDAYTDPDEEIVGEHFDDWDEDASDALAEADAYDPRGE